MEYDLAARRRLGRAVRAARTRAGYKNRAEFADKLRRSARQVQALENGESGVGPDTWAAAAEELGWPLQQVYDLLDGTASTPGENPPSLTTVSDEELAAEVLRRMKAGGEHGGDTAATNAPATGGAFPVSFRPWGPRDKREASWVTYVQEAIKLDEGPQASLLREALAMSALGDTVPDAVAAHEEEGSIAGEQEESDTP